MKVFREFPCLHNPHIGVCNDEGGNYCPEGGCDRAMYEYEEKGDGELLETLSHIH